MTSTANRTALERALTFPPTSIRRGTRKASIFPQSLPSPSYAVLSGDTLAKGLSLDSAILVAFRAVSA